jgi:hypothetical protein
VISSLAKRLWKSPFCHSYTSFGVWPRDHYMPLQRSTTGVCHALLWFPEQMVPSCSGKVSHTNIPSCTMWFSQVTKYITMYDAIPYLISKQAIPYLTHGTTCCPGVSTPKIQSLADASMTNHITWWNPTICTILTLLKPHHQSSPWSTHISIDGRPSLTKTQAKLNITKDGKACTTLMTTWLSKTNQVWTQILKYEA